MQNRLKITCVIGCHVTGTERRDFSLINGPFGLSLEKPNRLCYGVHMSQERATWSEAFAFTEREWLDERISDKRFQTLLHDEQTVVHQIEVSTNNYGEFLFVTMSRRASMDRAFVTFWGLGFHELRERWFTGEWRFYETQQFRHQIPQKISPEDAQMLIQDRRDQIGPDVTPLNQSKRAQLFELLADMTDEDGAYSEIEDFGWLDEDLE